MIQGRVSGRDEQETQQMVVRLLEVEKDKGNAGAGDTGETGGT